MSVFDSNAYAQAMAAIREQSRKMGFVPQPHLGGTAPPVDASPAILSPAPESGGMTPMPPGPITAATFQSGDMANMFPEGFSRMPPAGGMTPMPSTPIGAEAYKSGSLSKLAPLTLAVDPPKAGEHYEISDTKRDPIDFRRGDRDYGFDTPAGKMVQTGDNSYEIVDEPRQPTEFTRGEREYGSKVPGGKMVQTGDNSFEMLDDEPGEWEDRSGPVKILSSQSAVNPNRVPGGYMVPTGKNSFEIIDDPTEQVASKDEWRDESGPVKIISRGGTSAPSADKELDKMSAGVKGMRNDGPGEAAARELDAMRGGVEGMRRGDDEEMDVHVVQPGDEQGDEQPGDVRDPLAWPGETIVPNARMKRSEIMQKAVSRGGNPASVDKSIQAMKGGAIASSPAAGAVLGAATGATTGQPSPTTVDELEDLVKQLKEERRRKDRGEVQSARSKQIYLKSTGGKGGNA